MYKRLLAVVALLGGASVLLPGTTRADEDATVCTDYNTNPPYSLGAKSIPWFTNLGGFPPTTYVSYDAAGGSGPGISIESSGVDSTQALRLVGSSATVHRLDVLNGGAYPTRIDVEVAAHAGNITFTAYNSSNVSVDSDVATHGGVTSVTLSSGGGIAYLLVTGGDNEDWIDDFCMTN